MIIVFAAEAQRAVDRIDTWWRRNRPSSPDLFERELAEALERIRGMPGGLPIYAAMTQGLVRRMLLPNTRNHVYYVHDDALTVVRIVSVWGAILDSGPPLE